MNETFIYNLISKQRHGSQIRGFYLYHKKMIKEIYFEEITEGNLRTWYTVLNSHPTIIENEQNMFAELCEKNPNFSGIQREHYDFLQVELFPGRYFPRIYRPLLSLNDRFFLQGYEQRISEIEDELIQTRDFIPLELKSVLMAVSQLSLLTEGLKTICKTVHPSTENLNTYGNELRNLLILTCTEVEAQLRGVYLANTKSSPKGLSTNHYVSLKNVMKLNEYTIQFGLYPWLGSFSPFSKWTSISPTRSLKWYDAYNSVKHDREKEFSRGNLMNLLDAIASLAILLNAQYGDKTPYWRDLIGQFFVFVKRPQWKLEEYYMPPFKGSDWIRAMALVK